MEQSSDVAHTVSRFYEAIESGTMADFDGVVSADPYVMVIGTDRWLGDRNVWREAFPGLRGIKVEQSDLQGFREGRFGWAVDRPSLCCQTAPSSPPDCPPLSARKTTAGGSCTWTSRSRSPTR